MYLVWDQVASLLARITMRMRSTNGSETLNAA